MTPDTVTEIAYALSNVKRAQRILDDLIERVNRGEELSPDGDTDRRDAERWRKLRPFLFVDGDCTDHTIPDCWSKLFLKEDHPFVVNNIFSGDVDAMIDQLPQHAD